MSPRGWRMAFWIFLYFTPGAAAIFTGFAFAAGDEAWAVTMSCCIVGVSLWISAFWALYQFRAGFARGEKHVLDLLVASESPGEFLRLGMATAQSPNPWDYSIRHKR